MCIEKLGEVTVGERKVVGEFEGIPVGEDLIKLKQSIRGGHVESLKRLIRTVEGPRVESMSVLVEFRGPNRPERILIGCTGYPVRPYVRPPLRCYECQRYSHVAAVCKGSQGCSRCGGDHKFDECENVGVKKCCNSGGEHAVTFSGCEVRKTAVQIEEGVKRG